MPGPAVRLRARLEASLGAARPYAVLLLERLIDLPRNLREAVLLGLDLVSIPFALALGVALHSGSDALDPGLREVVATVLTVLASAVIFLRLGLYRAIVRFMGHQAVIAIVKGVTLSALALSLVLLLSGAAVPPALPVLYWTLMLVLVGGTRLALRSWYRNIDRRDARRVAIYGAGAAGRQLLNALRHGERYETAFFVDDNPLLQGRVINDVPVVAPSALPALIARHEIEEVFLAMASLAQPRRREIIRSLADFAVQVRSIPSFEDLVSGRASIAQVREVSLEDLLGRAPVPPRPELLAPCISGRTVMVTGAGGSIGSELCRQILAEGPEELLLFEASEFALYSVERELGALALARGSRTRIVPLLGSVRDAGRVQAVLRRYRVHTIYHAAAYKHVPIVELNVVEGVRNNVAGTLVLARAAARAGVDTFVLVSTDKAVRPTNVMGATKRVSELIMQALAAERPHTRFVIVRFGNVIGSSGSVIPLFRAQIDAGGPVTVTHADAERYFMTIPEAAQLVLQAGAMGSGGDVFVLDMGQPVRILDLARRMVHLAGMEVRDAANPHGEIEIRLTGLRPGEKLREELLAGGEVIPTGHPMILRAFEDFLPWPTLEESLRELESACEAYDLARINRLFARIVGGFTGRLGSIDPLAAPAPAPAPVRLARVERLHAGKSAQPPARDYPVGDEEGA